MLQQEERVVAAWLCGSFGTGKADDLSDLDVSVVVTDEHIDDFATERRAFAGRLGKPLLFVEGPQNAPAEGGYYLMMLYDGQTGPQQVDWYWHAQSRTTIPAGTLVLFDRAGLPRSQVPPAWGYTNNKPEALRQLEAAMTEQEKRADEGRNIVSLFFAMLLIAGKYVARRPSTSDVPFSGFLRNLLRNTRRYVDPSRPDEPDADDDTPFASPGDKLDRLRDLGREMETLLPQVAQAGAEVPTAAALSVRRFLDFVEADLRR